MIHTDGAKEKTGDKRGQDETEQIQQELEGCMRLDEVQNKGYNQKFIIVKPTSAIQKNRRIQANV